MEWPGNSIELKPIEYLWYYMKNKVANMPRLLLTLKGLEFQQNIISFIANIPRHIEAVIKAKDGNTKYWFILKLIKKIKTYIFF